MDTQMDRLMREVARDMGKGNSYNRTLVGLYFGTPDVEAETRTLAVNDPGAEGASIAATA